MTAASLPIWGQNSTSTYEYSEHTKELDDWAGNAFTSELVGTPVPNGDSTETVTYRVTPDSPEARDFVRLEVVFAPQ